MPDEPTLPTNEPQAEPTAGTGFPDKSRPPLLVPAFVVIALLLVLITLNLRRGGGQGISPADVAELQTEANALREQLNRERMALGLRPLGGNVESMQDIAERLGKDAKTMVSLANSFQTMLAEKDAEMSERNAELIRSEQLRRTLANESARLQSELQRAIAGGSETESLRGELTRLKQERDVMAAEVATLRGQLAERSGGVSAEVHADLERRFEETRRGRDFFEARVAELEAELAKSRLFAKSDDELLPAAVKLIRRLRPLENKSDADISSTYSSLGVEIGASVLHTLSFKTGSSELGPDDEEMIRKMVAEVPDSDLVLAIGYASETGNVDNNRELSSARATAAAELFSSVKRPGQLVQAVYLGQTDRFSDSVPERNQIVELWHIRRKQP